MFYEIVKLKQVFDQYKTAHQQYGKRDGQQVEIAVNEALDAWAEQINQATYQKKRADRDAMDARTNTVKLILNMPAAMVNTL
jgi:type IV secretory pathway VirD2 relaxase